MSAPWCMLISDHSSTASTSVATSSLVRIDSLGLVLRGLCVRMRMCLALPLL